METQYIISDIELSKKGAYCTNKRYVNESVFFVKLYEKLCCVTKTPEERANIKKEFIEKAKEGNSLLIQSMKFEIKIIDKEEIPKEVQFAYYSIIHNRPLTLNEWRNLKQKYPEYFTEEKINELCSINKIDQKFKSK